MTAHANVLGGSNAARLLACPASFKEQLRSPPPAESVYAAEGTLLHDVIADKLRRVVTTDTLLNQEQQDTIENALAMLEDLKIGWGGGFKIIAIEKSAPFPGVPGSFGTVDLVLASKTVVLTVDFKFGSGVPVYALYSTPEGDTLNPQPVFYTICMRAARPRLFKGKKLVMAIIQPRLDSVSDVVTDNDELDEYQAAMTAAYLEALSSDPHRERGDHCRFASCKATCKLWTGPVFDIALLETNPVRAALKSSLNADTKGYGEFLGRALDMAEIVETWAEEIRKQGHSYLEGGGLVPGWKLVPKRATRQWTDPETVPAELLAIGALDEDIFDPPKLKSVAQMEKTFKALGHAVPTDLYMAVSSGTTLAHEDDRRPDATQATVTAELQQALRAL